MWRIWDLHVHTPASYRGDYANFIESASKSIADVIGINDYCTLAGYEEVTKLGGIPGKVIFPVVELRMNNLLETKRNTNGVRINFHIIFDNDPNMLDRIKSFIGLIDCEDDRGTTIQLGTASDLSKVSVNFKTVVEALKKYELYGKHALIWLPYDEYGGIDEVDPVRDGPFKLSLINSAHILGSSTQKQIDFFKWTDEKYTAEQYEQWFDRPKPCIKGSDAHEIVYPFGCLRDKHSQPTNRYCWINADLTFEGLKQIVNEPDRVFIGEEPSLITRIKGNKTKFIKSVSVKRIPGSVLNDIWFDDFDLELNGGLVAIIGNKGGGKSAITDIISLCGNTFQDASNFSFLTNTKFRRPKPTNLSDKFEATLVWEDGNPAKRILSANPDKSQPERVKYIPQNFLEKLCTDVESDDFERELKQIIYSHTPADQRLGKASLDDLINYKSELVSDEIIQLQGDLHKVNVAIVELENKEKAEFTKAVENNLKLKQGELFSHVESKPQLPQIDPQPTESQAALEQLNALRQQMTSLEIEIADLKQRKSTLNLKKEELSRALQFYRNLGEQLSKIIDPQHEFAKILAQNSIELPKVFSYKLETYDLSVLIEATSQQIVEIDNSLDTNKEASKAKALEQLTEQLRKGQEDLDKPGKLNQKYLDDLKIWEQRKVEIEGSTETEGTLNYLQNQLEYLKTGLAKDLRSKYDERKAIATALFTKKLSLLEIRKLLFQPVTNYISEFKELQQRYDVKIDVALEFKLFADNFFGFINQQKIGTYSGKEDGYRRLQDLLAKTDLFTQEDFIAFAEEVIDSLKHDKRSATNTALDIQTQLRKDTLLVSLYDFIYNADYIQPTYNLKLGDKTLQELSPGERGALLLIFYLILDKDDIPLIIDQPEENLDNESVYYILVHFIKKVKETRQIVIVTHNPNLAVVCDADQIVHMQIEKNNKNAIKFISGAIENVNINKSIVNILEGTLPAFNNRESKYLKLRIKNLDSLLANKKRTEAEQLIANAAVQVDEQT